MAIELVVFDWDGTLIDSTSRIVECLRQASSDVGFSVLPDQRYRSIIGLGLPEALRALYPHSPEAAREALRERYTHHYIAAERDPCLPYEGAEALLDALAARGIRLAIATGKNRPGLERAFFGTGWRERFVSSRTSDETASKPDPRMLQEILAECAVPAACAIMVGDTAFDLDMALRAGVSSVGITHGAHEADELFRYNPLALIDRLDELLPVLDRHAPALRRHTVFDKETA